MNSEDLDTFLKVTEDHQFTPLELKLLQRVGELNEEVERLRQPNRAAIGVVAEVRKGMFKLVGELSDAWINAGFFGVNENKVKKFRDRLEELCGELSSANKYL